MFISALAKVNTNAVFDFKILTALKGWVGLAPQGRGALHNYRLCARHRALLSFRQFHFFAALILRQAVYAHVRGVEDAAAIGAYG